MAYINLTGVTQNSISMNIAGLDTAWTQGTRYVYWLKDSADPKTTTLPNNAASGGAVTYSGLTPNTSYYFTVDIKTAAGVLLVSLSANESTSAPPTPVRPTNWNWESPISAGSPFAISATEWNKFTQRINAFRLYKSVAAYGFTQAAIGKKFTSIMYNEAANGIGAISGTWQYLPTIEETGTKVTNIGNKVKATYLIQLKNALNSVT